MVNLMGNSMNVQAMNEPVSTLCPPLQQQLHRVYMYANGCRLLLNKIEGRITHHLSNLNALTRKFAGCKSWRKWVPVRFKQMKNLVNRETHRIW